MALIEGQLVLCTVKVIDKANIFFDIEEQGEGSMVLSEVAAGRIRNLREYVFPGKKIVCKVLNVSNGHVELSLRRVTAKERQEVLERYKKERSFVSMLKTIASNPEEIVKKIKKEHDLVSFLEEAKDNTEILKKYFSKEQIEKLPLDRNDHQLRLQIADVIQQRLEELEQRQRQEEERRKKTTRRTQREEHNNN